MSTSSTNYDLRPAPGRPGDGNFFTRAEAWLDERGKGAWIAAMVLGFVFLWPVGLALLAYMIWSKRMFNSSCPRSRRHSRHSHRNAYRAATRPSGNSAFDAYKADTLRRLEDEQKTFEDFLQRLRDAKDKAEFDEFMEDRARRAEADMDDAETGRDDDQTPPYGGNTGPKPA